MLFRSVDDLVFADGRTRMGEAGGAVLHAALGAGLWCDRVGCVSVRGADYPQAALSALAARGVDLAGVRALVGPGVRTWLLYEPAGRRMVTRLGGPSHEEVSPTPEDVPAPWRGARAFHLAPMPFERQRALVAALAAPQYWTNGDPPGAKQGLAAPPERAPLVSIDPHLPIREDTLPAWRALLAGVDVLFLGEEDLQLGGDEAAALVRLAPPRLRYLARKRGARGGTLYDLHEGRSEAWAAAEGEAVDPTGAGDAFAAAFVTALIEDRGAAAALRRGAAAAALAVSGWGAAGLLAATTEEARRRAP